MSGIDGVNSAGQVQSTSGKQVSPRASRILDEIQINKPNAKGITNEDLNAASNMLRGINAVKLLMERSPVGQTLPTNDNLMKDGYNVAMHINPDGSYDYSSPAGSINYGKPNKNGETIIKYRTDKFEQTMVYDKNGKAQNGIMIIRDDLGNIDRKLDFVILPNGKMYTIE